MLMDEPFGAVDPIVRDRLQNEFLRLQESIAKTILFVTHDIDEAIKMGDLVAVFQTGGVLAQFGPPHEILAAPASEFVARFVGQDRGLKRLSLLRVADVAAPDRRSTARPGDSAAEARAPGARRPAPLPARGRRAEPADRLGRRRGPPARGPGDGGDGQSGLADGQPPDDAQGCPLDDARRGRPDRHRRRPDRGAVGLLTIEAVAERMREGDHAPAFDQAAMAEGAAEHGAGARSRRPREDPKPEPRPPRPEPGRPLDRLGLARRSHVDDMCERFLQHLQLSIIAVVAGFVISLVLGIWAYRQRRAYALDHPAWPGCSTRSRAWRRSPSSGRSPA